MAEQSKIEWTDATFNPWIGCTAVSPACDHCYAEMLATKRLGVAWGKGQPRRRTAASTWKAPLAWNRKAAKEGRRMRVFCASLADVFDAEVPDDWRLDLFALIAMTPHLDWLLLTKRPKVARDFMTAKDLDEAIGHRAFELLERMTSITPEQSAIAAGLLHGGGGHALTENSHLAPHANAWPLPNVWLGTTVENQAMAAVRIPHLLATPAAVRFLSMEPLLGPVDLTAVPWSFNGCSGETVKTINALTGNITVNDPVFGGGGGVVGLDWIITGGESGSNARPSHPDWFRSIRDQCAAAGVPFLFKQWGEWAPGANFPDHIPSGQSHNFGDDSLDDDRSVWRVGKKAGGRHLDGVLHDGYPVGR